MGSRRQRREANLSEKRQQQLQQQQQHQQAPRSSHSKSRTPNHSFSEEIDIKSATPSSSSSASSSTSSSPPKKIPKQPSPFLAKQEEAVREAEKIVDENLLTVDSTPHHHQSLAARNKSHSPVKNLTNNENKSHSRSPFREEEAQDKGGRKNSQGSKK